MCRSATKQSGQDRRAGALVSFLLLIGAASAQTAPAVKDVLRPDWRRIGNSAIELSLASPASGPLDRAWFSADGSRLFVQTRSARVFETANFEKWQPSAATPPEAGHPLVSAPLPDGSRQVRTDASNPMRLYAFGAQVFRSDDGGLSWANLTAYEGQSIIGANMKDLAVSPQDPDELAVANDFGLWRSMDGGITWTGLNDSLPNLPALRLAALPQGSHGVRLTTSGLGVIEWAPGEKQAWRVVPDATAVQELAFRRSLSASLSAKITATATAGNFTYAGSLDGRLWTSADQGRTWNAALPADRGPVESIFADPADPRFALAAMGGSKGPHVLRTMNGGQFWDDLTSDLPEAPAHGIAADRASGTLYVATDRGMFSTRTDLNAAGPVTGWTPLGGLPEAPALDVKLDAEGNQVFVALDGYGVYAAMAPHRLGDLRLVNAADFSQRPAAPGSLLSVYGGRVRNVRAGDLSFPVLAASETESQIQVPFSARGPALSLALDTGQGTFRLAVPVEDVSPAIFVDRDGTPLVLNADTGVLLDAMNPAHSNGRIEILATGLGAVAPGWPTGMPGPAENPPRVVAQVRAYLDRAPLEVSRAVLAPGYIGLDLVEVQLPALVNAGPAELYVDAGNQQSNRVRIWVEP